MSNLLQRLLLFFLGVPAIVAIIVFIPAAKHGATVLIILGFVVGASLELSRLLREKGIDVKTWAVVALGTLPPFFAYAGSLFADAALGATGLFALGFALLATIAFSPFALVSSAEIPKALPKAAAYGFVLVYPGALGSFIVLIASEPRFAMESLLTFAFLTFGNDSLAWLAGMTLARKRGIVAVSPNKSLVGFAGGILGSLICAAGARFFFPRAIEAPLWVVLAVGLIVGIAVILGDLFESALKRSAGAKDSGTFVPGRGGFLDSLDSLLFAAPVFYGLSIALGLFR